MTKKLFEYCLLSIQASEHTFLSQFIWWKDADMYLTIEIPPPLLAAIDAIIRTLFRVSWELDDVEEDSIAKHPPSYAHKIRKQKRTQDKK